MRATKRFAILATAPRRVRLVGWQWGMFALWTLCAGCQGHERATPESGAAAPLAVKRGSRVVVEGTAGEFQEATVLEELDEHLRLQSADGSHSLRVSRNDVYSLTHPETESAAGQYAVCEIKRLVWTGCKVLARVGARTSVLTASAEELELSPERVLRATELTKMNIEHAFSKTERQRRFMQELNAAGAPHAPQGWRPGPRERVVARRRDDWHAGRVVELEDNGVRVAWEDTGGVDKVPSDAILPEPPYPVAPARGDFALMRPRAESEPWVYVRVRSTSDEYKVEDIKGEVLRANRTALIPMRR
jgi:hypothetical protein